MHVYRFMGVRMNENTIELTWVQVPIEFDRKGLGVWMVPVDIFAFLVAPIHLPPDTSAPFEAQNYISWAPVFRSSILCKILNSKGRGTSVLQSRTRRTNRMRVKAASIAHHTLRLFIDSQGGTFRRRTGQDKRSYSNIQNDGALGHSDLLESGDQTVRTKTALSQIVTDAKDAGTFPSCHPLSAQHCHAREKVQRL
ncbi:hypothetical protein EI94DRAFT_1683951 [Lactarius quietus]|nr:hypothetical protein EI94DRAFT_1683951 [Lactarius quietus]